jgi:DNA repair exonuclease SbcCD ATPase subunit
VLENGRNTEAIEWMIKYKEEKSRVEEMESEGESFEATRHQDELENTLVSLMNDRDSLQAKLDSISSDQNGELDAILADVTKLEKDNSDLKAALDDKSLQALQHEEKLRVSKVQLEELQEEMKKAMECLETAQSELSIE